MPSYSQQQENQQQEEYILIREWGSGGAAAGQFSQPADVVVDSKDNVFVTDITAPSKAVQKIRSEWNFYLFLGIAWLWSRFFCPCF